MKIWTIGAYTFLRQIRDYKAMAAFTIFPILVILLLGTALDNLFTPKTVEPMKVGTYSEDLGFISEQLNLFLTSDEMSAQLETIQATSLEAGIENVKSKEWDAFVYIGAHTSDALNQGKEASIVLYGQSENSFAVPLLESFVRAYHLNASLLSIRPEAAITVAMPDEPIIKQMKIMTEGKIPRGIDYYAVVTALQCLLFGALFGVFAVTKDQGNHMHSRLFAAPVRGSVFMTGKLLGSTMIVFMLAVFIVAVTRFGFKSNWDGSLWVILLVLLLFSLFAAAMGMLLGYLTRSTMISSLIMFIISTLFTLVAGGFSPMKGELIERLRKFSPNAYAQDVLFASIYDDKLVLNSLTGLTLFAGVAVCLTVIAGRRSVE